MVDFLLQATVNNLLVSASLALIAWGVQARVRSASLANLLWALVLIKLVTPPLFCLPLLELPRVQADQVAVNLAFDELEMGTQLSEATIDTTTPEPTPAASGSGLVSIAFICWAMVSALLAIVAGLRIVRFHRSLLAGSVEADSSLGRLGRIASDRLELRWSPAIRVTPAHIAPFVWWSRGRAIVVLPRRSIEALGESDLLNVVAHELAHIKRKDHWFRWLEWLAIVFFWWNPIMWWARQQLRVAEEMACDDLVLRTHQNATQYANSLLNMAELLAARAVRPPVVACAVNSGGNLEKRLKMILSKQCWQISPMMRIAVITVAGCLFPLGFVYGQETRSLERRLGGAIEAGELTLEEAHLMLETLRKSRDSEEPMKIFWEKARESWDQQNPRYLRWEFHPDSEGEKQKNHPHADHDHPHDKDKHSPHQNDEHAETDADTKKDTLGREYFFLRESPLQTDRAQKTDKGTQRKYADVHQLLQKLEKDVASAKLSKEKLEQQVREIQQLLPHKDRDETGEYKKGTFFSDQGVRGRYLRGDVIQTRKEDGERDRGDQSTNDASGSNDDAGKPKVTYYFRPDKVQEGMQWLGEYQFEIDWDSQKKQEPKKDAKAKKDADERKPKASKDEQATDTAIKAFNFYMNLVR